MPSAARLTDMHTCPMVTGTVPHVGGPISGPGEPTVLIGGMVAARVGDMAVCTGPPDTIVKGSMTVQIGHKPAARLGDTTAHGGVITVGCPTVMIGDLSAGGGGAPTMDPGQTSSDQLGAISATIVPAGSGTSLEVVSSERREVATKWYQVNRPTEQAHISDHLDGIDFTKPVGPRTLKPDDVIEVWVRDGGVAGGYGAPPESDPSKLGIDSRGRHLEVWVVDRQFEALESTASDYPEGVAKGVGGEGGGIQYSLPDGWKSNAHCIK